MSRKPKRFEVKDQDGTVYEGPGPEDDPWAGFAQGKHENGDFVIECTRIKPTPQSGVPGLCRVDLQIQRRSGSNFPWVAKFLMHPTFLKQEQILTAKSDDSNSRAREYFWSVGRFVVGAVVIEADDKKTRLELDFDRYVKGTEADQAPEKWWTT